MPQVINDAKVAEANKFLIAERQQLMLKREFAIARRDNLFWKCVWNVFVPNISHSCYDLSLGER